MMFIQIIPVTRRGANTPPETHAPELLRVDLIQRASPIQLAGTDFWCLRLTLDGGQTINCTGTIADLVATLGGSVETGPEVEAQPEAELPDDEPETKIE